jgi:aspartate carbamoyltransferase catalytic subunit
VSRTFEKLGVRVTHELDAILPEMDVVNMLRIQKERIKAAVLPSVREYVQLFGMSRERLARCKPGGIELATDVADGPNSSILRQVSNGMAVRMAVLFLCNQAAGA